MSINFRPTTEDRSVALQPLDIHLNVAVMHLASRVCPCGFQVAQKAPSTYPELFEQIKTHRRIVVYSGEVERSIYADKEVTYCFRAWHDWCHWSGRHDFTLQGKTAVWEMQSDHLVTIYGDSAMVRRWRKILYAEIVGQWIFHATFGAYPDDQMAFTRRFLELNEDASI